MEQNENTRERRKSQIPFYDAITDRRNRPAATVPAMPGTIRPGPGEAAPLKERRRVPGAGME